MAAPELTPLVDTLARFLRNHEGSASELGVLIEGGLPTEDPRVLFTLAPRLAGKGPGLFTADDLARVAWPVSHLAMDEIVRIIVLARAVDILALDASHALVDACYRQGEVREKVAVLRALPFLDGAAGFVAIAADACRSHVQPVFDAIACENPIPAAHFEASTFHQMVLKAIFTEVPIARIVGLAGRIDAELVRMAQAYIDERRAASRPVPDDATWIVNYRPVDQGKAS